MATNIDPKKIEELLTRGVDEVIELSNLKKRLLSGQKLRIKLGIDPTSPNLHLGRANALMKLKDFQDLGHQIVLIIGDFTGQIGDTSDKVSERPMLSEEQVKKNMKNYKEQAGKILDIDKTEFHYNSEWLAKLDYKEISQQANIFSLAEFIARKNIRDRLRAESRISLRELLYPLMQGYDSVAIKADVEIGGTDQRFNILAGRQIQEFYKQKPQDILTVKLISGTDGRKMSSSWGNTINLLDSPEEMFGKIMSADDKVMIDYFVHCTRIPMEKVKDHEKDLKAGKNPRDVKMVLAEEIVRIYWGEKGAKEGKEYFVKVFQKKDLPDSIPELKTSSQNLIDVLVESKLAKSKSDAKRLVEQKSIKINGKIIDAEAKIKKGDIIQKGKRFFIKIT